MVASINASRESDPGRSTVVSGLEYALVARGMLVVSRREGLQAMVDVAKQQEMVMFCMEEVDRSDFLLANLHE